MDGSIDEGGGRERERYGQTDLQTDGQTDKQVDG